MRAAKRFRDDYVLAKDAAVALSHNIGAAPQACGISIIAREN